MKGIVLAGGASSRFGGTPKGLALLGGRAMALHVADCLRGVCDNVVIEAPPGVGYEGLGLPLVYAAVEHAGKGPLAALATGLACAEGGYIAFAPCDMPLLSGAIYQTLIDVGGPGAYARTPKGVEPLVAVLSAELRIALLTALAADVLPRTHVVLDAAGAQAVDFPDPTPFANVNTPHDLAQMESRLRAARL